MKITLTKETVEALIKDMANCKLLKQITGGKESYVFKFKHLELSAVELYPIICIEDITNPKGKLINPLTFYDGDRNVRFYTSDTNWICFNYGTDIEIYKYKLKEEQITLPKPTNPMEQKYEYLIALLTNYIKDEADKDGKVKLNKSTNRIAQAQMLLDSIKNGELIEVEPR